MADGRHLVKSLYISTKNYPIPMKFGTQQQIWNSITKHENLKKSRRRTAAILKIVFGHNSAADCPISVKFCAGKSRFS